jgi:hypothetical protein
MATCQSTPSVCAPSQGEDLRTLVEVDRRRASIGLHIATDVTKSARTMSTLWLPPAKAEALARELLAAVESWQADQAVTAWTGPCCGGGR